MKFKTLLASLGAVALLTACEDIFEDGSLQPDGSTPNLIVRNPTDNQVISKTDGLQVDLTATDKDKVKELQVSVRDIGGDADFINFTTFPDKQILEFDTVLSATALRQGDYTMTIIVTDHRTNVTTQEVAFTVK